MDSLNEIINIIDIEDPSALDYLGSYNCPTCGKEIFYGETFCAACSINLMKDDSL